MVSVYRLSASGPAALSTLLSFLSGVPGIESVKPSPLMVSQEEDDAVVVVEGEDEGEAPGVVLLVPLVPLVLLVPMAGCGEVFLVRKITAAIPITKINSPPTIHGKGLRFCACA